MEKRATCRKHYKELRNAMTREAVVEKSRQICKQVLESEWYQHADMILGYYPLGNEVDCVPILEQALKDGKRVSLPKTGKDCSMEFYEITSLTEDVIEGTFHIMEPKAGCQIWNFTEESYCHIGEKTQDSAKGWTNAVVLVPGVVFDRDGNRYGYGRGFYDRYFTRFPELFRVALAYNMQISEETLACLATDVKMHLIVTENEGDRDGIVGNL